MLRGQQHLCGPTNQGRAPVGGQSRHAEHARAMGMDSGHMPYPRLAKALPPVYLSYVFGQMAMHTTACSRFGISPITFDEMQADPRRARRQMALLLRGAGGTSPSLGLGMALWRGAPPATARSSDAAAARQRRGGGGEAAPAQAGPGRGARPGARRYAVSNAVWHVDSGST